MGIFAEEFNIKSNQHFEAMKEDLISLSTNNGNYLYQKLLLKITQRRLRAIE